MKNKNTLKIRENDETIYQEIKEMILETRNQIYHYANSTIVQTYWMIGKKMYEETKNDKYGKEIIKHISERLTRDFGNGFDVSNLRYMRQFYLTYPKHDAVRRELSWTHYRLLIRLKSSKAREFYENEIISNNWSSRQLERQIKSHYYERIVSNQTNKQLTSKENSIDYTPIIKDPYILEFLQLPDNYHEKELEDALLTNITQFLNELGKGYSFVGRQVPIVIDSKHYSIDLLFRNDELRCYVLIELKVRELKPNDLGQLQMYLNYYKHHKIKTDDNPPVGILLCADKNETIVKYSLPEDNDSIYVSNYLDYLPSKDEFKMLLK